MDPIITQTIDDLTATFHSVELAMTKWTNIAQIAETLGYSPSDISSQLSELAVLAMQYHSLGQRRMLIDRYVGIYNMAKSGQKGSLAKGEPVHNSIRRLLGRDYNTTVELLSRTLLS